MCTGVEYAVLATFLSVGTTIASASMQPDVPEVPKAAAPEIDKTVGQTAEKLDAAEIGSKESRKRKKKSSKDKFKQADLTGLNLASTSESPGIQI